MKTTFIKPLIFDAGTSERQEYQKRLMKLRGPVVAVLMLVSVLFDASTASATGRRSYTGSIDGAAYRVEVPEHWNGTLVL